MGSCHAAQAMEARLGVRPGMSELLIFLFVCLFISPHLRICLIDFFRDRGRERKSERETLMGKRNIDELPPHGP